MKSARSTYKDFRLLPVNAVVLLPVNAVVHMCVFAEFSEEARGFTGRWTAKLANYCEGNAARDFMRNAGLPLDP